MAEPVNDKGRRVSLELREDTIERLDALRKQWSLRSRGAAIQRLLDDLLQDLPAEHSITEEEEAPPDDHLQGAIVLVSTTDEPSEPEPEERSSGINLPGFVSKRTTQLKRSLKEPVASDAQASGERFEVMDDQQLSGPLQQFRTTGCRCMAVSLRPCAGGSDEWLGHDIWPSSDASETKLHLECSATGDAWVLPQLGDP